MTRIADAVWERCFIAALTGSAREPYPPEKDEVYLVNRAHRIADKSLERIGERRALRERLEQKERAMNNRPILHEAVSRDTKKGAF